MSSRKKVSSRRKMTGASSSGRKSHEWIKVQCYSDLISLGCFSESPCCQMTTRANLTRRSKALLRRLWMKLNVTKEVSSPTPSWGIYWSSLLYLPRIFEWRLQSYCQAQESLLLLRWLDECYRFLGRKMLVVILWGITSAQVLFILALGQGFCCLFKKALAQSFFSSLVEKSGGSWAALSRLKAKSWLGIKGHNNYL